MSQTPILSIVVAVYNGEQFLSQFFECIEHQALESYELILVNDGSTDASQSIMEAWQSRLQNVKIIQQANQGVSVARNSGLDLATGKYLTFPDIDDKLFLHVTWLNIYRREFINQHGFRFEPGLRHQDIPWTTEVLLAAQRVQYTDKQFYDYYIHSASVSHKPDTDDTLIRSAHHYMKILEMLDAINERYRDKTRHIAACRWQIAKEGLGIIHTIDCMKDDAKKKGLIKEFFDRGIWGLIWKNAHDLRLRWRLGRRYFRLKKALKA